MAADGKVTIEALLDTSEYDAGVKSLSSMTIAAGGLMVDAIEMAVSKTVELGAGVIQAGMSFDSSMSQVAATMGTTVDSISELRDFALEMGSTTAFSASQAADALNFMALAGYDADTSMKMLPNVLNLAAAGGMELATASDMVTDAQSALGLSIKETSEMVDMMAKTSSKTNTSVSQLGSAILTVGGTARNLAGGTVELSTALGLLADNGVKGAEGGTALRNIILSLTAPTDKAKNGLDALGISILDASGNMRPLNEIFADFNDRLDGMGEGDKTAILNDIFNKADLKSVNALLATTSERWDEVTAAVIDSTGAAEAMANTQLDNLAGDITLFQSALEGAQIAISDGLTPTLRGFVQFGGTALSTFTEGFKNGGLTGAVQALVPLFQDTFNSVLGSVGEFVPQLFSSLMSGMDYMTEAGVELIEGLASGAATAVPAFLSQALPMLVEFTGSLRENAGQLIDAGLDLIMQLAVGLAQSIPILIETVPDIVTNIAGIINDNAPKLLETGIGIIQALAAGVVSAIPTIVANIPKILQAIVNVFMAFNWLQLGGGIITLIKNGMTALANAIPATFQEIGNCSVSFLKGIQWSSVGRDLIAAIQLGIEALATVVPSTLQGIAQTAINLLSGINWVTLGSDIIAAIQLGIEALASSIPDALLTIANTAVGIVTGVDWLTLGINIVSGIASGLLGAVQIAVNAITNIASSILDTFCGFFGIHSPSTVMKEQGSYIVQGMVNGVGELPGELLGILNDALGKVLDWGNNLASNALNAAQKMLGNVTTTLSKLPENIQGYLSNVISTTVAWERDLTSNAKSAATNMANAVVDSIKALPGKVEAIWISITKTVSAELSAIKTSITSAWDSIKSTVSSAVAAIKSTVSSGWDSIKSTVSSAVAAIKSTVSSGWDSIKSTVSGAGAAILNSVKNNWNSIKNSISSTMTAAKNSAVAVWNGIGSTFSSIGKNIVSGIVSGITNAASSLYGSLKSLAKNALSSAKDALGIHSPSAVMRDEVGKWIPEGVAAGISANIGVVLKATDGIAKGVSSSLNKAKGEAAGEKFAKGIIGGITGQKKYAHASAAAVGDAIVSTAQKKLKNYQTIHDTTAAYEVGFWEKILKSCKNGTQAYYDAYAKHASALDAYNKGMTESRKNLVALEDEYAQNVAKIEAQLVTDMNSLWDTYHSTVDSRAKELCQSLGGLFNAFSSETENTTEILLNNMRSQVDGMMQWQASLEELEKRCVDSKLIEELRALGPEASANIELLSRMSDAELETYVALWQKKMELCRQQATTESQGLYADTLTQVEKLKKDAATEAAELTDKFVASVKDLAKKTKTELGALPKEFKSVGKDAVKGITTAIKENGSALTDEVRALMTSAVKAAKDELEIKSPSRVFRDEVGKWIPAGIADGIEANADDAIDAVDDLASMISDTKPIDFDIPVNFDFEKFGIQMESAVRSVRGALIDDFRLGSISANAQFSAAASMQELSRDDRLDRLLELVGVMTTEIRDGKNIVLDDGTLVGRMSKKMDAALAGRRTAALRGR